MNRSAVRELTFKLIYSLEIQREKDLQEQIELYIENNNITDKKAIEYIEDIIKGINLNVEEINKLIEKNLKADWQLERISKIDLSLF